MHQYKLISRKGEGTFSEVLKAQSLKTGNYVAIKCMKNHFTSIDQVNQLREIQALKKLSPHPHIIKLYEVLYDEPTGRLALVFELMDMNLYETIKDRKSYLAIQKVKHYMFQLLKAIEHMHKNGIFHRDIKPENILIVGEHVKLADFGSCRGMYSEKPYTEYISTRWYRAPECLMTDGYYDYKMDIWGVGCVFFEILSLFPLFPGNNELDQIHKIHNILGTPNPKILERFKKHATHMEFNFPPKTGSGIDKLIPNAPKDCIELIKLLLIYDPEDRITASQALRHECFKEFWEAEKTREFQNSYTSMKFSPHHKQTQQLSTHDSLEKLSQHQYDYEKSPYYHSGLGKLKSKKPGNRDKFPFVKVNVNVEGLLKSTQFNDSFAEEDPEKGATTLPPLKNTLIAQLDTKLSVGNVSIKKKDDYSKKSYTNSLKHNLSNQHLAHTQKKTKKLGTTINGFDYMVVGKKANVVS